MSMEEWTGFELSEQVLDEATQWIAVLDDLDVAYYNSLGNTPIYGNASNAGSNDSHTHDAIIAQFNEWLSAHVQHQQAYAEMSLIWAKSVCVHEISGRLTASNVFAFKPANNLQETKDFATIADEFKRKHIPILLPYHQDNLGEESVSAYSSSWVYGVSLCLIAIGLTSPLIQHLL